MLENCIRVLFHSKSVTYLENSHLQVSKNRVFRNFFYKNCEKLLKIYKNLWGGTLVVALYDATNCTELSSAEKFL